MTVAFILMLLIFIALYLLSKNRYDDFIEPLDKKEYELKALLPIGFFILDIIKYKYLTRYDRYLQNKTAELKGGIYSAYFLQVHWANKIVLELLMLLLLSFTGMLMGRPDEGFIFFAAVVLGAAAYASDKELDRKVRKRRLSIQIDFPDFLNSLTLLINAGMTVSGAWSRITIDGDRDTPLYNELRSVMNDINNGKSEIAAYEDFAKRCRMPEITKFVSVVVQNFKKGNAEIVNVLKYQAKECWEMRKHAAKRIGEEASSKVLFPMMLMFFAVVLIVVTPAVISITGSM